MEIYFRIYGFGSLLLCMVLLWWNNDHKYDHIKTVDPDATKETKALYANLKKMARDHILFGQQDALAYGVEWKTWHKSRSDIKDLIGTHPAVVGWDVSKLGKQPFNIDTVDFGHMKQWIVEVYKMGGINTISWHFDNFHGGTSWDTKSGIVQSILPGGKYHQAYNKKLDLFADFLSDLKTGFLIKKPIPIIFRPFHEHTGSWFWWGKRHCTEEEYKTLWKYTIKYLRDYKGIHHLLYAYSPDIFKDAEEYLERYPGDDYIDILGFDDYHDVGKGGKVANLTRRLDIVGGLAKEKDKVAALTETGFESIPKRTWWTDDLGQGLKDLQHADAIAWVLVWRNARKGHHYGPYPDHISADNFVEFSNAPGIIFQEDLPNLYKLD